MQNKCYFDWFNTFYLNFNSKYFFDKMCWCRQISEKKSSVYVDWQCELTITEWESLHFILGSVWGAEKIKIEGF